MISTSYADSKFPNRDRFIAECGRLGIAPERVYEAIEKTRLIERAKRHPEEESVPPTLSDEDERILTARADVQYLPLASGNIVARSGLIEYPDANTPHADYCLQLLRSARRKQAILKDALMTPNEHRALSVFWGWYEMYQNTDESLHEGEQLALAAMPSVVSLTDATFDAAFAGYPPPTVVYFHESNALWEPKASLRIEKLAQSVSPHGRVARVNIQANIELWQRFKVVPKPEPLLLFDMNGFLKGMMSSTEPFETIAAWFEPHVTAMRRTQEDPRRAAMLEQMRALHRERAA